MVLENATASDNSFSSNDAPADDFDPYSTTDTSTTTPSRFGNRAGYLRVSQSRFQDGRAVNEPIYINIADIPRPFSIFGTASVPTFVLEGVIQSCKVATDALQRPVTQDEANAFAFHLGKSIRIGSYGGPIGLAIGTAMAFKTRKTMRFPFYTPFKEGSRFSRDAFGPLTGGRARFMWHQLRVGAYTLVGVIGGQIFFGSYALSTSLAGRAMDPRLKDFTQTMQQRARDGRGRKAGEGLGKVGNQEAGPKDGESYDMARQRRGAQAMARGRGEFDDASPTGGAFQEELVTDGEPVGFMSEQEVRANVDVRTTSSRDSGASSLFDQNAVASRESPQAQSSGRRSEAKSSGSAWDRLRHDAMAGGQSTSSRGSAPSRSAGTRASGQGASDALGENFSFSSSDEERHLAKSEAQKDFDARLEGERRGQDFGERGGGGRKWN